MKASQIQQVIKSQAAVLTALYSEYRTLRTSRATYNAEADKAAAKGNDEHAELYLFQAEVFSPYIRKMKVKIAKLEDAQKAMKLMLGHAQAIESFGIVELVASSEWLGTGAQVLASLEES